MQHVGDYTVDYGNNIAGFRPIVKLYIKQDKANNYTKFKADIYGEMLDAYALINAVQYQFIIHLAGNEKEYNGQIDTTYIASGGQVYIGTQEQVVYHDEEGDLPSKELYIGFNDNVFVANDTWQNWGRWRQVIYPLSAPTIPRGSILNNVSNFNIGDEIIFSIDKKVSNYYDKLLIKIGDTTIKTIENIINGDSFAPTNEELETIYSLMSDTSTKTFNFELSTYSDNTYTTQIGSTSIKTAIGTIINANPIFSNFVYADINDTTVNLTGSNQKIIKGHNQLQITINNDNKAIAQKGSIIKYYKINDIAYEYEDNFVKTIENYNQNNIVVYAIDSRGNSTSKTIVFDNFIEYVEPNIGTPNSDRTGGINEETILSFSGAWWNDNFGSQNNTINATYQYTEKGSNTYINGTSILNLTTNNSNISLEQAIKGDLDTGFDTTKQYDIKVILTDKIDSYEFIGSIAVGDPAIDIYENNVALGGVYDETLGGRVQGIYDAEDIYLTFKNYTPEQVSTRFGGTWELVGKGRTLVGVDENDNALNVPEKLGGSTNPLTYHRHDRITGNNDSERKGGYGTGGSHTGTLNEMTNVAWEQLNTGYSGDNTNHNNWQPYITCYIWKRTA